MLKLPPKGSMVTPVGTEVEPGDEVVVENFGGGCMVTGTVEEGDSARDVRMRYAQKIWDEQKERKERRALLKSLKKWQPPPVREED